MTTVCFIVASMDKRIPFLERCIKHYRASKYAECDIYCYFQGSKWESVRGREVFKEVVIDPNPRGVFTPRYELMKRFAKDYDYCIIIDDDLYILPETDYYRTVRFLESNKTVGAACLTNVQRAVKNVIKIVNSGDEYFNVIGGLVLRQSAVQTILEYFSDKERDYTFDCIWLLLWVRGYDLAKDFRSWSRHVATRKINGEYTGFNESRANMKYEPFLTEYLNELPLVWNHGRHEVKIPDLSDINDTGLKERARCKRHS